MIVPSTHKKKEARYMNRRVFAVGDWVEVRSKSEILATLDHNGQLDGMPFMPEMFQFCGKRFQVYKSAHKTCDTVFPIRGRWVDSAVHLKTRCSGEGHGGCQAGCLIFWKTAWLKAVDPSSAAIDVRGASRRQDPPAGACSEVDVLQAAASHSDEGTTTYRCQATLLPYYTRRLEWWDIRQYVADYRSGNVTAWRIFCGFIYSWYYQVSQLGIGLGRPMEWLYDRLSPLWGGPPFPRKAGRIPDSERTPAAQLNLQPGELVRVKSLEEILETITVNRHNRGMKWDAELAPYCGGTYRVLKRVTRIINEVTGVMQDMKTPCIILDSVVCEGRYSDCRMFCPRAIYPYWREIWLERVNELREPVDARSAHRHQGAATEAVH